DEVPVVGEAVFAAVHAHGGNADAVPEEDVPHLEWREQKGAHSLASSASSPCFTMSPGLKRMPCRVLRHSGLRRIRNSRSIPKCFISSCWAFFMMAFASGSFSSEILCSYQP